jgi:hypothetical protein
VLDGLVRGCADGVPKQAEGHPDRTGRRERGFAVGYGNGFHNVVTGQK